MLEFVQGDMFDFPADIRVNTVNCVGVMGAGVALAFKQRYPEMFRDYERDCKDGRVKPGTIQVWKSLSGDWIVNFPTKRDWRDPSRYEDIDAGLDDLRHYLDGLGPVTIALPALGCGHGGLDWARVSNMIRNKLAGADAHILVFEPAASRQAGRAAAAVPTDDERQGAKQLGYRLLERESIAALDTQAPVYTMGDPEFLSRKWIALLPSRAPGERELQALRAIAAEFARSEADVSVALVHGTRVSEEIASLFVSHGIGTVLLLPFGVLTRKSVAKQATMDGSGSLTIASAAPAGAKWSRQIYAQTMDMLRANASATLLSDPEPDWLTSKGLRKWGRTPISFVRYEATPPDMREALGSVGAKPIGRRGEDGTPNIDRLVSALRGAHSHVGDDRREPEDRVKEAAVDAAPPYEKWDAPIGKGEILSIAWGDIAEVSRQELFDVLLQLDAPNLWLAIKLPQDASDADRQRLVSLGFNQDKA